MGSVVKNIIKICLPFVFGIGILWWMYRGTDWTDFLNCLMHDMNWGWMILSLTFGILPALVRGWRWKMSLAPLGENPKNRTCADAIFISYAASLVVPRIGEVTRCGTLKTYEETPFSKALGTVVTERMVDSVVMLVLTALAILLQLPTLLRFLETTGTDFGQILSKFTSTGYLVTAICLVAIITLIIILVYRLALFKKGKHVMNNLLDGMLSLKHVKNLPLYLLYSVGIWFCYFMHFYLAFFCFDFTSNIAPLAAFLIFCVGSFAVLVPTPNGAGPWHFAVKTMLVIYGVAEPQAILFALVVHTIQTFEVILLGAYGWADLNYNFKKKNKETLQGESPENK